MKNPDLHNTLPKKPGVKQEHVGKEKDKRHIDMDLLESEVSNFDNFHKCTSGLVTFIWQSRTGVMKGVSNSNECSHLEV